jgi:hypothetical protein
MYRQACRMLCLRPLRCTLSHRESVQKASEPMVGKHIEME